MKALRPILLLLLLVPAQAMMHGKDKKPQKVSVVFSHAQYVYVEAVDGQEFSPRLYPDDRQAIADVEKAVSAWPRYTLVERRDEADLIFVVRKGRLASADAGVQVGSRSTIGSNRSSNIPGTDAGGTGPNTGTAIGSRVGAEAGPPDDLLEVYQSDPVNSHRTLIWQRTLADGLDAPDLALFKQLKDRVERDYPNQNASNSKKP